MSASNDPLTLIVEARAHGWRVDHFLSRTFGNYSRALLQKAIEQKGVLVNGLPVKTSKRLRVNDVVGIQRAPSVAWSGSHGALAWTDSVVLAGTLLAQFLLDNKKLENWIVWAVVNVFAIYTYATSGLPLVAFQYVFFLANTAYGYVSWRRSWRVRP